MMGDERDGDRIIAFIVRRRMASDQKTRDERIILHLRLLLRRGEISSDGGCGEEPLRVPTCLSLRIKPVLNVDRQLLPHYG